MADLKQIVERSAGILATEITAEGAEEIARRSRGTPRVANRLLRRVRDFAEVKHTGTVDDHSARGALDMLSIDKHGFDQMDRRLLLALIEKFSGGPVGIESLAAALSEERDTLEEVIEPLFNPARLHHAYAPRSRCHTVCLSPFRHDAGRAGYRYVRRVAVNLLRSASHLTTIGSRDLP